MISTDFFRNRDKREALEGHHIVLMILRIIFDSWSKILIFSTFLYVWNEGQFSSIATFSAFYAVVLVLFIMNIIFYKREKSLSMKHLFLHLWRPKNLIGV